MGACPANVAAQVVTGRVVLRSSEVAAVGAVVSLVAGAERTAAVLTNDSGRFRTRAVRPGRWIVRVDYPGHAVATTSPLLVGATDSVEVSIRLDAAPIRMDTVRVLSQGRCKSSAANGMRAATLWSAINAALEANDATQREGRTPLDLTVSDYRLEPGRQRTLLTRRSIRSWSGAGFASALAAHGGDEGYVRRSTDSSTYFVPDAAVLTSPQFIQRHCFSSVPDERGQGDGEAGLAFEPADSVSGSDVRGALWVDAGTFALKRLDVQFVERGAPPALPRAHAMLQFARLASGRWIVSRWSLRMPVETSRDGAQLGVERPARYVWREREGEVRVVPPGEASAAAPPMLIRGRAFDSTRNAPLGETTVRLGSIATTTTDAFGRFGFLVGDPYSRAVELELVLDTRRAAALGLPSPRIAVRPVPGDTLDIELALPSRGAIERLLCDSATAVDNLERDPAMSAPAGPGMVLVSLRMDDSSASPVGTAVQVQWTTARTSGDPVPRRYRTGWSDADGRVAICGLPIGVELSIAAPGAAPQRLVLDAPDVSGDPPLLALVVSRAPLRRSP